MSSQQLMHLRGQRQIKKGKKAPTNALTRTYVAWTLDRFSARSHGPLPKGGSWERAEKRVGVQVELHQINRYKEKQDNFENVHQFHPNLSGRQAILSWFVEGP